MTARLDIEDVITLLQPGAVISACGLDAREHGRAWRLRTCPWCGARPSRAGAAIYRRRRDDAWRATHHGHEGCAGDLLDVIAASEGIDRRTQLPRLLERAAQIAGIAPTDPDIERRIAERIAQDRERRARADAERAAALARMPALWDSLDRRSLVGERYLAGRGLDPAELRARGDVLRYSPSGELALAMRDLETGAIVGIQYRSAGVKDFRTEPWSDASNSALAGCPADIDPEGTDVAILVEGLSDTLAACIAFPTCAIYGAAGAAHMESIAATLAPRLVAMRGWLLIVVDDDEPGIDAAADAIVVACDAGLEVDRSLLVVDLGTHHDLADAYAAGWRWNWSETTGSASS
ncbi:MAG: hypothetical protein M3680_14570 [Myxococcota bacterium]|nr:hypothetical protein [Myxococcota bacterium]